VQKIWLGAILGFVLAGNCLAQQGGVSSTTLRDRADSLAYILDGAQAEIVTKLRRACATGQSVSATEWSRSLGSTSLADAGDECPTLLLRVGRDGALLSLYRDMMVELTGQPGGHEQMPAAIAAIVMKGGNQVTLGNQRAAVVTPALALDAGFTVAYQKRERATAAMPGLSVLKPIAERCLSQQERDLGLCYATGYTYGARAASGQGLSLL
jgi:hypothetical protein